MQRKIFSAFLMFLLSAVCASATTVERSVLVSREPGVFTANIRAALNTKTNKTLIIWQRHRGDQDNHSIWGRLLQADGTPTGAAFPIVSGPNAQSPSLAFNPDTNQFLLTYSNEIVPNRFQVQAQRLNSSGRRSGAPIRVSLAADLTKNITNYSSRTVYDSVAKGYVILFLRYATSTVTAGLQEGLYGTVLNSNLTVRKPSVLVSPLIRENSQVAGPTITDLKFHSPSGKLLAAGYTTSSSGGFGFQYFVSKIDPALQTPKMNLIKLKSGLSSGAAPDVNLMVLPDGNLIALFVEGTGLKKRRINALGAPTGSISFFYSDSVQSIPVEFPVSALAINENRSEAAVVSIEDSTMMTGRIWLQTVNATGGLTGGGFSLQSNLDTNGRPAIVALPTKLPAGFLYAVVHMEGGQVFPPSPTASSGLVLLRVNTTQ